MATSKILQDLSVEQEELSSRIFDLVVGRVLKRAYVNFDAQTKEEIGKIFSSNSVESSSEEKENFIKKHIPNFEKLFEEEAKIIEEEIKAETEKQI